MTLSALLAKTAREITWDDIARVATDGLEEGPQFELKRELSANSNQTDPWMAGSGKIGRPAVDDLAKEIVALANSQGGLIIVGIEESDDKPARAAGIAEKLVPKCIDCADRLSDSMLSLIDPRLAGLSIMGVQRPSGAGEGVLVIHVPRSTFAPHGFGSPPKTYVRRGHRSDPMTMSELQSVLWDTRTRSERIKAQIVERRGVFASIADQVRLTGQANQFRPTSTPTLDLSSSWIGFRASFVADFDVNTDIRDLLKAHPLKGVSSWISPQSSPAFERFSTFGDIINRPRAVWLDVGTSRSVGRWVLGSDGLVEISGFHQLEGLPAVVWPGWFTQSAWELCCLMYWFRNACGNDLGQFIFSGDLSINRDTVLLNRMGHRASGRLLPERDAEIGPLLISRGSAISNVFADVEREILYAFGANEHYREKDDIGIVFDRMGIDKPK